MTDIESSIIPFLSYVNMRSRAMTIGMYRIFSKYGSFAALAAVFLTFTTSFASVAVAQQQLPPAFPPPQNGFVPPPFPPPPRGPLPFGLPFAQANNFRFGLIVSIQNNNESGQPEWLVSGHWRGNLFSFNQTAAATTTNATTASNSSGSSNNASTTTSSTVFFNADLSMINLNGSGEHTHVITNFKLANVSSDANGTKIFYGNSTISMKDGPIVDVPTTIKILGKVISIMPDPSKVNHHFGNTPIYGLVLSGRGNDREAAGPIQNGNATGRGGVIMPPPLP
jgi:hypothetical protein